MEVQYPLLLLSILWEGKKNIVWSLAPNTQKCLKHELYARDLFLGEYDVSKAPRQRVDYIIRDSRKRVIKQKNGVTKGTFSFVPERNDVFEVCFKSKAPPGHKPVNQTVKLSMKIGTGIRKL